MSAGVECRREGRRILLGVDILRPHPTTDLTAISVTALIDTGASSSGVAPHIAAQLSLPSIGKEPVDTAGGTILSDGYLFRVAFPIDGAFPFVFDDITGFELNEFSHFQAVIGTDILARCDFTASRDGRCSLTF